MESFPFLPVPASVFPYWKVLLQRIPKQTFSGGVRHVPTAAFKDDPRGMKDLFDSSLTSWTGQSGFSFRTVAHIEMMVAFDTGVFI